MIRRVLLLILVTGLSIPLLWAQSRGGRPGVPGQNQTPLPPVQLPGFKKKSIRLPGYFMGSDSIRIGFTTPANTVTISGKVHAQVPVGIKIYGPGRRSPYYEALVKDSFSFVLKRPPGSLKYREDFIAAISNFVGRGEVPVDISVSQTGNGQLNAPSLNTATVGRPPIDVPTVNGGDPSGRRQPGPRPGEPIDNENSAGPTPAPPIVTDNPPGPAEYPRERPNGDKPLIMVLVHGKTPTIANDTRDDGSRIEQVNTHAYTRYYWGFDFICRLLGVTNGEIYTYSGLRITKDMWFLGYRNIPATPENLMLTAKPIRANQPPPLKTVMLTYRDGSGTVLSQGGALVRQMTEIYAQTFVRTFNQTDNEFVLIGHSMGGIIARWFLRDLSDRASVAERTAYTATAEAATGAVRLGPPSGGNATANQLLDLTVEQQRILLRDKTRYLVTLATPHRGSEALQKGWDIMNYYRNSFVPGVHDFIRLTCSPLYFDKATDWCNTKLRSLADGTLNSLEKSLEDLTGTAGDAGRELKPATMQEYNSGILHPDKMRRTDGTLIPLYALSGHTPDMDIFGPQIEAVLIASNFTEAAVIGYLLWNVFDFYFDYYINIPFFDDLDNTLGSADPNDPNFTTLFNINWLYGNIKMKLGYNTNRFKLDALKLVIADGVLHLPALGTQNWGRPARADEDLVERSRLLPARSLTGMALMMFGAAYRNGESDGENDSDGLVGFNSGMHSASRNIPSYDHRNKGNWYSVHSDPVFNRGNNWFPWDLDNHRNICFNPNLAKWISDNLIKYAGPYPKTNTISGWKE